MQHRQHRHVVHHGKNRQQQYFGQKKKKGVRCELGEKYGEWIAHRKAQCAQRVVLLLAQKTGLQHQGRSKEKCQPEQPGSKTARFVRRWVKRKAEENDHDQNEDNRGRQQFARAKLRAKLFAEQNSRIWKQAHSGVGKGENRAKRRAGARVGGDRARIQPNRARAERRNFRFAVEAHQNGAA